MPYISGLVFDNTIYCRQIVTMYNVRNAHSQNGSQLQIMNSCTLTINRINTVLVFLPVSKGVDVQHLFDL
jgi:hypothetical protein